MQDNLKSIMKRAGIPALSLVMLVAMLASLSFAFSAPAAAQDLPTPTPSPADPVWRAFRVVRDAIEEEKSVDLTYVKSYLYDQVEWRRSIDACRDDVLDVDFRPVYYGWNFTITDLSNVTHFARVSFDLKAVVVCDREEAGASAPNPTGIGNNPPPVPGGALTGSFELGGHVFDLTTGAITAMQQSGMKWAKFQVRWGQGDGVPTGVITNAKANGFKVMLSIVGLPDQLASGGDGYIQAYAAFTGEAAAAGADAIEVWNEANIDREWPAGQINGGNYTKLLAAAYNAIKTKNANTIVISGAPAPTGFFGAAGCATGGCNDDAFMQQMSQAGAASYMDCVGLHYNEGIVPPSQTSADPRGEYPTYYFGSMTARGGLFGKPICYTELGYLSDDGFNTPIPGGFAWAANVTVENQASWLADAATRAAALGNVRMLIVWNINSTTWNSDPQAGYAIIRPGGGCPACATLGQVMRK